MTRGQNFVAVASLLAMLWGCDLTVQAGAEDGGSHARGPDSGAMDGGATDAGGDAADAGCTPRTCDQVSCGQLDDGCGDTLACGCDSGESCGGAGVPGQCGVPLCQNGMKDPGEGDVDCGGTCAACAAGRHCSKQADCAAGTTCDQTYCLPGVWSTKAPLPTPRLAPAAVVGPDGRIWVIGGFTHGDGASSVVEVYNPQTDSWTTAPPMNRARYGHSAVIGRDGRLYVFGGQYDASSSPFVDGVSKTAEVYDFTAQQWTNLPELPDGRMGASSAVLANESIMVFGGISVNPISTLATPVIFSPSQSTWTSAPTPMVTGRNSHASAQLPDGRIFVAGGFPSGGGRTASAEMFDASMGGWSTLPQMPFANADASAAPGPAGLVYVFGGNAGSGDLGYTLVYDVLGRQWKSAASMPTARRGTAAVRTADGRIWVIGGAEAPNFSEYSSNKVEVLTP